MGKLTSGRVKKTPQSGITSDRYQFLGLEQAEPNLGDPLVGPSSIGANPIKVGAFYQLAAIAEYPGERYWSTQVGIGTTLGIISVYANGELPNNAFGRIHGLNFVGTGVTIETPSVDFIGDVGIATVRFAVTDILNQGQVGQILYNGPSGVALGSTDLNYYNGNVGIGTSLPKSKLEVIGDVFVSGTVIASNLYGNLVGTATTATDVIGGIASVTSLSVSGISTLGGIKISAGIITAVSGIATYYGRFIGTADFATTAGIAYTTYADFAGFSTSSGIATSVSGGIASVTSLRVSGNSILGFTSTTQLIVSGISTLGDNIKISAGIITATTGIVTYYGKFVGTVDGEVDNAAYARTAGVSTSVIGGIASVTNVYSSGLSTLTNVYVNDTISGPSTLYIDPAVVGDNTGTVVIKGNLEVKGTTTTIESQTLTVVDKNIELATDSTSDSVSDGGGITLKGSSDHTITFNDDDNAWQFSENLTPSSNDSKDLGVPLKKWKTLYVNNISSTGISTLNITSATQLITQNLNVSGVSTLGFVTATDAFYTGVVTATRFFGIIDGEVDNAAYAKKAGVATDVIGGIASVTSLSVSGISTLGGIKISDGIITAGPGIGIATYYGRFIGTADFATTAGIAYTTYADKSGIATDLGGGAKGSIPYQFDNNDTTFLVATTTNGAILTYNTSTNAPVWTDPSTGFSASSADYATTAGFSTNAGISTNIKGGATGNIPYQTSSGVTTFLTNGTNGTVLKSNGVGAAPSWVDLSTGVNVGAASSITIAVDTSPQNQYLTYVTGVGDTTLGISTTIGSKALTFNPSSGNLGIGTTNPLEKLHILGNLLVAAGSATTQHITQKAYELNNGTLSWEGTAGELFSITNNLTSGSIFSVNDVSGIPSIDVDANGTVSMVAYGGNVAIGTTNPTSKLQVDGDVRVGVNTSRGLILTSANGTKYRLLVSDAGTLSTVVVP